MPNLPNVNPLIDFNLVIPILTPRTEGTTTIRIDHRFSDRDLVFGRLTRGTNDHELNITPMLPTTLGDYPRSVGTSNRHWPNITGALTWEHTFSSSLTNELLVNVSRDYHRRGSGDFHTNYAARAWPAESADMRSTGRASATWIWALIRSAARRHSG